MSAEGIIQVQGLAPEVNHVIIGIPLEEKDATMQLFHTLGIGVEANVVPLKSGDEYVMRVPEFITFELPKSDSGKRKRVAKKLAATLSGLGFTVDCRFPGREYSPNNGKGYRNDRGAHSG